METDTKSQGVKVRAVRRRVQRVHTHDSAPVAAAPFVNVVVLDNTVPGGWRYEQRPVEARNGTH